MDPFVAEIRMFGGNFAPKNWALCNGAIMSIAQNTALFSVLSNSYGGNGTTTFNLPNLVDNVPLGAGSGSGLSPYVIGQKVGAPTVILLTSQMPPHSHNVSANPNVGDLKTPTANTSIARAGTGYAYTADSGNAFDAMDPSALGGFTGSGGPHNNVQPYLGVTFIIALQGIFPERPLRTA